MIFSVKAERASIISPDLFHLLACVKEKGKWQLVVLIDDNCQVRLSKNLVGKTHRSTFILKKDRLLQCLAFIN